jgi:hypothetical protein
VKSSSSSVFSKFFTGASGGSKQRREETQGDGDDDDNDDEGDNEGADAKEEDERKDKEKRKRSRVKPTGTSKQAKEPLVEADVDSDGGDEETQIQAALLQSSVKNVSNYLVSARITRAFPTSALGWIVDLNFLLIFYRLILALIAIFQSLRISAIFTTRAWWINILVLIIANSILALVAAIILCRHTTPFQKTKRRQGKKNLQQAPPSSSLAATASSSSPAQTKDNNKDDEDDNDGDEGDDDDDDEYDEEKLRRYTREHRRFMKILVIFLGYTVMGDLVFGLLEIILISVLRTSYANLDPADLSDVFGDLNLPALPAAFRANETFFLFRMILFVHVVFEIIVYIPVMGKVRHHKFITIFSQSQK